MNATTEQRNLAVVLPAAEHAHECAVAGDFGGSATDEEEPLRNATLLGEDVPRSENDLVGNRRDAPDDTRRTTCQERVAPQQRPLQLVALTVASRFDDHAPAGAPIVAW